MTRIVLIGTPALCHARPRAIVMPAHKYLNASPGQANNDTTLLPPMQE